MLSLIGQVASLFLGIGILLVGNGFLGTLIGVRAALESFPTPVIGAVMSTYFLGFLAGTIRCPALIRRVGHIRVFAALAAAASIAAATHGLVVDPLAWALLRGVTGFSIAGLYLTVESWLNAAVTNERRGQILGGYTMITLGGAALGQYLILVGDLRSQVPFTLAASLFSLALIPIALTRVSQPATVVGLRLSLLRLHAVSPVGCAGALASGLANGAFWGMGPTFGQRLGLSEVGIAAFMSAVILGGATLQWPIGHLSDRRDRRTVLVAVCFAGALVATAVTLSGGAAPGMIAGAFLYGGAAFSIYPLSMAHANDQAPEGAALETARSLLLLYGIGAICGPMAAGGLMETGGPKSLFAYFAAVLTLLGVYGWFRIVRKAVDAAADRQAFVPLERTTQEALLMQAEILAEPTARIEAG